MSTFALTVYVLMWPVIVAVVLGVLIVAFTKEWLKSRRSGEDLI
ncbi:putative transporter small subunit [Mycolicibacterium thermoresistibile]